MFRSQAHLPLLKLILAVLLLILICQDTQWGMHIMAYGMVALGVLFLSALLLMVVTTGRARYRSWRAPRESVTATVERKWTRSYDYDVPREMPGDELGLSSSVEPRVLETLGLGSDPTITLYTQYVYWACFRVGDAEMEFGVPEDVYITLEDGQEGVLSFKGERFLAFRPLRGWEKGPERLERQQGQAR